MRRPFIAGNWKMNLTLAECTALAEGLAAQVGKTAACDVAVCAPHVYLAATLAALKGSAVALGAQDVYHQANGAFTGETSVAMLQDIGCRYVVLGHSERRHILGETNQDVCRKVHAALAGGLTPIVCVGETLEQREAEQTTDVVWEQCLASLAGLSASQVAGLVVAYEPVWAIGTGKVATKEQAEQVHADLRTILATRYNSDTAEAVRIQYGGSVKPGNAAELLSQPNIDGALVGGASLKVESFMGILAAIS